MRFFKLIHADDTELMLNNNMQAIQKKKNVYYDCRFFRADGEERVVNVHFMPVFDDQGNHIKNIGTIQDITERKRMETELTKERDQAKLYFDYANVIFLMINIDGTVKSINRKGCEVIGLTEKEIVGAKWIERFIPDCKIADVKGVFDKLIKGEIKNVEFYENPLITACGEERIISWHNSVLRDEAGKIIGTFGSGRDITESKKNRKSAI